MKFNIFIIVLTVTIFSSCDGLFYYPTQIKYRDVTREHDDLFLDSKSGNRLHGLYFPAKNPKALVVFFHGNYRNVTGLYRTYDWVVDAGYSYMIIDYSGYGKSTGRATRTSIYLDGLSILNYSYDLAQELKVPIILIGQSLGGAILLGSIKEFEPKEIIELIVIDCSFLSYRKLADYHAKYSAFLPFPLGSLVITDLYEPHKSIPSIKDIPVLVVHCTSDKVVPVQFGIELYDKLESRKWFWKDECTHSKFFNNSDNKQRLIQFFDNRISEYQNSKEIPEEK
jgi:fermentation-respiration switch protein FrsA (DUF1100 family)